MADHAPSKQPAKSPNNAVKNDRWTRSVDHFKREWQIYLMLLPTLHVGRKAHRLRLLGQLARPVRRGPARALSGHADPARPNRATGARASARC